MTKIVDLLRSLVRKAEGRDETPCAICIDRQTVKTTDVGGEQRGYDGGKKIKGHKRHWPVDTLGLLLAVLITSTDFDDGTATPQVLSLILSTDLPRSETILEDNK